MMKGSMTEPFWESIKIQALKEHLSIGDYLLNLHLVHIGLPPIPYGEKIGDEEFEELMSWYGKHPDPKNIVIKAVNQMKKPSCHLKVL